jgi:MraZ protein
LSNLIGGFTHSVDKKGRFNVPAQIRAGLADSADATFVISRGPEGCLDAYPQDEWNRRVRVLRSIPNKKRGRYYKRRILSDAVICKMDVHNRILIPPEILREVGIKGRVFILGQLDHLELWDPDAFGGYTGSHNIPIEDVLEDIDDRVDDDVRDRRREW